MYAPTQRKIIPRGRVRGRGRGGITVGVGRCNGLIKTRLLGQQKRVHWTGLHRLLDSTTWMVSMTRTRLLGQQKRGGREKQREG